MGRKTESSHGYLKGLVEDASVSSLKDYRKNVSLIFDERQTKPNLVYRRFAGKLIGSTAVGDISEEFWKFSENFCLEDDEDSSTTTNYHRDIATHVIVCTVRGLFSKLCYPFAYFAPTELASVQLYPCTIEAFQVLESIGFLVRALVSDGGIAQ